MAAVEHITLACWIVAGVSIPLACVAAFFRALLCLPGERTRAAAIFSFCVFAATFAILLSLLVGSTTCLVGFISTGDELICPTMADRRRTSFNYWLYPLVTWMFLLVVVYGLWRRRTVRQHERRTETF